MDALIDSVKPLRLCGVVRSYVLTSGVTIYCCHDLDAVLTSLVAMAAQGQTRRPRA